MKKIITVLVSLLICFGLFATCASASPNTDELFDLDFDDASDADDWTTDRAEPESWETEYFDGDNRLHININESKTTGEFYHYQGKKYLDDGNHWNAEMTTVLKYSFYINSSWETDGEKQATGMWVTTGDDNGAITAYSVLEYQDSDANTDGDAQFRLFKQDGNWYPIKMPGSVKPEKGGWVDIKAVLVKSNSGPNGEAELWWYINNAKVAEDDSVSMWGDTTQILEIIINSDNFGVDQDYYYDDISLETRDTMSRGNGPLK